MGLGLGGRSTVREIRAKRARAPMRRASGGRKAGPGPAGNADTEPARRWPGDDRLSLGRMEV
jgi:hypothetical protein